MSTLAANLTAWARRLCGPVSARKTALRMPKGTLMRAAIATMTRVPRMALPNPPPSSSGAGGNWVKTARLSFCPPCQASIQTTEKRGIRATSVMKATSPLEKRSMSVLGLRSDFSSSEKSTPAKGSISRSRLSSLNPFMVMSCMASYFPPSDADDARSSMIEPMMFTKSVIARSTIAAYMSTATSFLAASGKLFARRAARVFAGEKSERLMRLALPTSMARAMVSPRARPKARMTAATMPLAAVGRMTASIVSQRVAPIPYAAILSFGGTDTRASRLMAVMVGSIMMERTINGRQHAGAGQGSAEEGYPSELQVDPVARRAYRGDDDEESPQAVNDARYCGQQLDQVLEEGLHLVRQLPEKRVELDAQDFRKPKMPWERKPSLRKIAAATPKAVPTISARQDV